MRYLASKPVRKPDPTAARIRSGAIATMPERLSLSTKYAIRSCVRLCTTAPEMLRPIMLSRWPDIRYKTPILNELAKAAGRLKSSIDKAPKIPARKARTHDTVTAARVSYIIRVTMVMTFASPSLNHRGRGMGS